MSDAKQVLLVEDEGYVIDRVQEILRGFPQFAVTLADTGEESMTAYRVKRIEKYLDGDHTFLLTYGDGVGDVDITASIDFHRRQGRTCTQSVRDILGIRSTSPYVMGSARSSSKT